MSNIQECISNDTSEYPQQIRLAGAIWLLFGSLLLLSAAGLIGAAFAASGSRPSSLVTDGVQALVHILVGAILTRMGMKSRRGTARDTLVYGIGSVVLGLPFVGLAGMSVVFIIQAGGSVPLIGWLMGTLSILAALGLVGAAVLALAGRSTYKKWLQLQSRVASDSLTPRA
jgi:hypothetical protein